MKRLVLGTCAALALASGVAFAKGPLAGHPNLQAAHADIKNAIMKITAAQKANEYDMEGHAAKAKELLGQAEHEITLAAEAANANANRK
jgi:hypothetical protein